MAHGVFGTTINCIDGRVQEPVMRWLRETYGLDYVDAVTEPGADRVVAEGDAGVLATIRNKVSISVQGHGSRLIALVGHYDCAANPVSEEVHRTQIKQAVQVVRGWGFPGQVIGLWVDSSWRVQVVVKSDGG